MRGMKKQLVLNALFGGGARVISLLVAVPMTAYLVARLGMERFGVWALVSSIGGALGILDFSLRTSFVKFLAEDFARGNSRGVREVLSIGFWGYALFSILCGVGLWFASPPLLAALRIPEALRPEAHVALMLCGGRLLAGLVLSVFPAVCDARQRMDLTNSLGLAVLVFSTALTIGLVEAGAGIPGVAAAQMTGVIVFHLLCMPFARRLGGTLDIRPRHITRRGVRRLLGYSAHLHVSSVCGLINTHLDKFLLSRWAGLTVVGSYELSLRIIANLGTIQPYIARGLLPASSHLSAEGDWDRLRRVYHRASALFFAGGIAPFVFVAATSPDLITLWIGRPDILAGRFMVILSAGYLVNSLSHTMAFMCQGAGRPDIQMRQSAVQLLANLVLSVLLLIGIGPLGAPLGTSLSMILGAGLFARDFHAHLGISTPAFLRETALRPFGAAMLALLPVWVMLTVMPSAADRGSAAGRIAAAGALYAAVWLPFAFRWNAIPAMLQRWRTTPGAGGTTP